MPLFACPPERREGLEAVKQAMGIQHHYLDGWLYLFYENKKFDIGETIAKLQRREEMEKTIFADYVITPSLKASMRAGIVQYIGRDKMGRPILFFNTARDSPKADQRPERQANMDMFLSWAVRCDPANPTATVTWLINQENASLMGNTDLIFQKDMALRISKFFPGVVAKMYICNMGSALTFVMRPLLKQLPKAISDCIFLYSPGDIRRGKLLEVIDAAVLPIALGGNNRIDHRENHELFATTIESYFSRCQHALQQGLSIKQMELMEAFPVDKDGQPRQARPDRAAVDTRAGVGASSGAARAHRMEEAAEETLPHASPVAPSPSRIRVDRDGEAAVTVVSSSPRRDRGAHTDAEGTEVSSPSVELVSSDFLGAAALSAAAASVGKKPMTFFQTDGVEDRAAVGAEETAMGPAVGQGALDAQGLPVLEVDTIATVSFAASLPSMRLSQDEACALERDWTQFLCHCVTLLPELTAVMAALRDDDVAREDLQTLREGAPLMRRVMHHTLSLFPPTTRPLFYPLFHWLTRGICQPSHPVAPDDAAGRVMLDCTSPDNLLLAVQGTAVAYVDECEALLEADKMRDRVLRRAGLSWPFQVPHATVLASLRAKTRDLWRQLVPSFQRYIEAKVAMSIGEFLEHYGLLVSGGLVDTRAGWYAVLFTGLTQYRELHRKNWLFFVFPPPFRWGGSADAPPTMAEMLHAQQRAPTLAAASELVLDVERSVSGTREQLGPASVARLCSHAAVERYMEDTGTKVYIPYEAQLVGVRPRELIAAERDTARRLLETLEQPLRELLFLSAILLVLEDGPATVAAAGTPGESDAPPTREETLQRVAFERRQCEERMESRRTARRIAVSVAKAAYEVQGTFSLDPVGTPAEPPARPDGYAIGLSLLLVEALVACRLPRDTAPAPPPLLANESFVLSVGGGVPVGIPSPTDPAALPVPGGAGEDEEDDDDLCTMRSARSEAPVDVAAFMRAVAAVDGAATGLAAARRRLAP